MFYDGTILLELAVNNGPAIRASLNGKGLLSAHLNVSVGTEDRDASTIVLNSIDESGEPNTVYSTWNAGNLSIGDKVEIRLLSDGEADAPTEVRRSAESPQNLFSDLEQARLLLFAISAIDAELMSVTQRARGAEPADELERIEKAVGAVAYELDRRLITPTLRRHPELLEEAKQKNLV